MAKSKASGWVVIVSGVLLFGLFMAQYGPQLSTAGPAIGISVDTSLHTQDFNGFHAGGYFGAGDANTHTGSALDSAQYVTAWAYDDYSEKILAEGVFCKESGVSFWAVTDDFQSASSDPAHGNAYRWDVYVNDALYASYYYPQTFNSQGTCGSGQTPTGLLYTALKGPVTGALKVTLSMFMYDNLGLGQGARGWYGPFITQQANLVSGAGSCSFVGPAGVTRPALTDENLTVSCDLGVASTQKIDTTSQGWQLYGTWTNQALVNLGNGPGFGIRGTFKAPSSAGIYSLRLLNTIFVRDAYDFTVNVAAPNATENAPPIPDVSVDPQPAWATGTTVTLSWSAKPNSVTNVPIAKVWVHVFYASDGTDLLPLTSFDGAKGSTTFVVGKNLDVRVFVASQDESGLYSVQREPTYQTYGCDINNSCRPPPPPGPLPIWIFLAAFGAIALAAAAFVPTDFSKSLKFKPFARVIVAIVGISLIGIAFLIAAG